MMQKELEKTKSLPLRSLLSSGEQEMAQERPKKSEITITAQCDSGYDRGLQKVWEYQGQVASVREE